MINSGGYLQSNLRVAILQCRKFDAPALKWRRSLHHKRLVTLGSLLPSAAPSTKVRPGPRQSPAAGAAAHGPIGTAIGDSVNQNFPLVIVNHKSDHGFPACRDSTQTRGDFIAETSLVRCDLQRGDGRFDLDQLSGGRIGPSISRIQRAMASRSRATRGWNRMR